MSVLRLVVGLGNPGSRYARTRHNVGFRLLDHAAGESGWKDFQGLGLTARVEGLILSKPQTFMNESGRFVAALSRYHKISPAEMLICFDDVALPLGRLRLRAAGSSGGQKGMESILQSLASPEAPALPRLRIGIGPQPSGRDSADFVLSRFAASEEAELPAVLERAWEAVLVVSKEGLQKAMNRFNATVEADS